MIAMLLVRLPGPRCVKAITVMLFVCAVVVMCFEWVFPWVSSLASGGEVVSGAVSLHGRTAGGVGDIC